eukprot:SAG31_NODE_1740_length_7394_cov_7.518849_7_plen_105_part_00
MQPTDRAAAPTSQDFAGWGSHSEYHRDKAAKLRQPKHHIRAATSIFADAVVHINGRTDPTRDTLWRLITENGGRFEQYMGCAFAAMCRVDLWNNLMKNLVVDRP